MTLALKIKIRNWVCFSMLFISILCGSLELHSNTSIKMKTNKTQHEKQQQSTYILKELVTCKISDDLHQIKLEFNDQVPDWNLSYLKDSTQVTLFFNETVSELIQKHYHVDIAGITRLKWFQYRNTVGLSFQMEKTLLLNAVKEDNCLLLNIHNKSMSRVQSTSKAKTQVKSVIFKSNQTLNDHDQNKVKTLNQTLNDHDQNKVNIMSSLIGFDFSVTQDSIANLIFETSDLKIPYKISRNKKNISILFENKKLSETLQNKTFHTESFNTLVQSIAYLEKGADIMVNVVLKDDAFDVTANQSDKKLIVSIQKSIQNKSEDTDLLSQKNNKISLNFQDIPIRTVLELLAKKANMNLVAGHSVSGTITLRLNNVRWDHALDIILRQKGLDKRLNGNILEIAPSEELASREKMKLEHADKLKQLSPLMSELCQINHARASDISKILKGNEKSKILSDRGSVQVVERTNSLLIKETQQNLKEIKDLIKSIDISVDQVIIEARIVEARTNLRKELGVNWGKNDANPATDAVLSGGTLANVVKKMSNHSALKNLNAAFPISGSAATIGFGFLSSWNLGLQLSALEADDKVEIISQPQIITTNNQKAIIRKGSEYSYETSSSSGTNTAFKDVSLTLEVTPQITAEGQVVLDVHLNNNEVSGTDGKQNPITSTNEIKTQLLVQNGETVVLGGIFKNRSSKKTNGVPVLSRMPFLGRLFSSKAEHNEKTEVMVFITPRILKKTVVSSNIKDSNLAI